MKYRPKSRATAAASRPDIDPAEIESRLTAARYQAIAETLGAVPWEADPATDRITYVGPQIEALTGYRVEEWTGDRWSAALHPDDREAALRKYQYHLQRRLDHALEYRLVTASGRPVWFRDIIRFVTGIDGRELARGLMIVIEDEKALERALRESEARYRQSERIARLIHWSAVLSPDGRWTDHAVRFSEAAVEIFGIPAGETCMTNAEYLARLVHPDDRGHMRAAMTGGVAERRREISVVYRIVRPDGAVRWVAEHVQNEYDEAGSRVAAFGIIQDITEQRQKEMDLGAAYLRADLANRAKTQFLATMSHELRTPLNAIIGFSEAMKMEMMGALGCPAYRDYAADINESGTFLLAIINELLDLSLIDSGEMKLEESVVQIDKIASSSIALLRARAQARGVALSQAVQPGTPLLRGDARRLKQAVLNLLSNAIKFTPAGGTVEISTSRSEDGLALAVRDTGIGIAAQDLERVMRPFVQVENWLVRKHEGAGLGLAITRGICELHGGRLALESELGKGTVARILLPAGRILPPRTDPVS